MTEQAQGDDTKPASLFAYFLELRVKNVRCFTEEQTLRLTVGERPARWTILLGDNGTGKSTVLQLLAFLRPEVFPNPRGPDGEAQAQRVVYASTLSELTWVPASPPSEASLGVGFAASRETAPVLLAQTALRTPERPTHTPDEDRFRGPLVLAYGPFRRLRSGALEAVPASSDAFVRPLFIADSPLLPAAEWYLQRFLATKALSAGSPEQQRASAELARIEAVLCSVLPGVEGFDVVIPDPLRGGAELHARTAEARVPLVELGLGYQTTLAWVTDLAVRMSAAYPKSANPLAEAAVVLVDEIDLHLHPRWQRSLLDTLSKQFPNVQWIVTSHSPLLVQNAPEDTHVAVLRWDGDHVVIDNDPERVRDWRLEQLLTSDLFGLPSTRPARLDDALAERKRLLGKSTLETAEKARLAELNEQLGHHSTGRWEREAREALDAARRAKESP